MKSFDRLGKIELTFILLRYPAFKKLAYECGCWNIVVHSASATFKGFMQDFEFFLEGVIYSGTSK